MMEMTELYGKYKKLLFTLAYQLTSSAADAEDAVHDVFVKFYQLNLDQGIIKFKTNDCQCAIIYLLIYNP